MVEAINYNLPIISANSHGGIKDILNKGKYGVLFKTNDHIKLASLINSFRSNLGVISLGEPNCSIQFA